MENILLVTTEYLVFTEEDAYSLIDSVRAIANVESSGVKLKKETAKKIEHYIVTIKTRQASADDFVLSGE